MCSHCIGISLMVSGLWSSWSCTYSAVSSAWNVGERARMHIQQDHGKPGIIDLPSPTVTPMVLALGIALILTALVTNVYIAWLGLVLSVWAIVGWFLEVL